MIKPDNELSRFFLDDNGMECIFFENRPPNTLFTDAHLHKRFELIRVLSGSLNMRLNGNPVNVTENQIVIIPPQTMHYGLVGPYGCTCTSLFFDTRMFCSKLPSMEEYVQNLLSQHYFFNPTTDNLEIISTFDAIIGDFTTHTLESQLEQIGRIHHLLSLLHQHCLQSRQTDNIPSAKQFREALDYINQNFDQNISSETLSTLFGYSQAYFCRRFKSIIGMTPTAYIRLLRLEKSRELILIEKECSINELASRCGFDDSNYFTRCFKEQFKVSPTQFMQNKT